MAARATVSFSLQHLIRKCARGSRRGRLLAACAFSAAAAAIAPAALAGGFADPAATAIGGGWAVVNDGRAWRVTKTRWDTEDEARFSRFIQALGRADCGTLDACLKAAANPYRHTDAHGSYYGDCADLPYFLRGYFAWKNGLPFSFQAAMRTADGAREDIRYSRAGNVVAERVDVPGGGVDDAPRFLRSIGGRVSTAMFRTHPERGDDRLHDDFYPVRIDRDAVTPGVIAYDIFGHVGIVYEVEDDGKLRIMSSHPDHTLTRTVYGQNYVRAAPWLGAGLKKWRPIALEGAERSAGGALVGGRVRGASNDELPDYSLEQYFGTRPHPSGDWALAEYYFDGRTFKYHDYVRRVLAAPGFAYDPVAELRGHMRDICVNIRARKVAVDQAIDAGIDRKPHPARLPRNIYGTYGDWESYSTPSRDARLKTAFVEFRRLTEDLIRRQRAGDPSVRYDGDDLVGDLLAAYDEEAEACTFTYRNSAGERLQLNFHNVVYRLWDLAFDPYQCIERRWGARGQELAACRTDPEKDAWHEALQYLRNQPSRSYDLRMDFTRAELRSPETASPDEGGLGWAKAPDIDVRRYLRALQSGEDLMIAGLPAGTPVLPASFDRLPCLVNPDVAESKIGNIPWDQQPQSCTFSYP